MAQKIVIILDNVRSAYNVGSIFRSLDGAFGSDCELILGGITPDPSHKEVNKTALGAELNLPWKRSQNIINTIDEFKKFQKFIVAIEECPVSLNFSSNITGLISKIEQGSLVLIFGDEVKGVSGEILEKSDLVLKLPMHGIKNSLNVASTVAVVAYGLVMK